MFTTVYSLFLCGPIARYRLQPVCLPLVQPLVRYGPVTKERNVIQSSNLV